MPPWLQKLGLTPTKAALIAVLGVVMVGVWGPQLAKLAGGKKLITTARLEPSLRPARTPAPKPLPTTPLRAANAAQESGTSGKRTSGEAPQLSLDDALAHDPFLTPVWSPEYQPIALDEEAPVLEPQAVEGALAVLLEQGVGMILKGQGETAATIGERTVRVGDEIDGFRVVEIRDNGVVLTPAKEGRNGA